MLCVWDAFRCETFYRASNDISINLVERNVKLKENHSIATVFSKLAVHHDQSDQPGAVLLV